MDRRNFLASVGALSAVGVSSAAAAADKAQPAGEDHSHHHSPYPAIATTAADCVKTGQVCIDHCLTLLGNGDRTLVGCARSVQETIAICAALQQFAAQNSAYLPGLAKVALQVCNNCEKECRKHEAKHVACRNCADACAACAKECKALAV